MTSLFKEYRSRLMQEVGKLTATAGLIIEIGLTTGGQVITQTKYEKQKPQEPQPRQYSPNERSICELDNSNCTERDLTNIFWEKFETMAGSDVKTCYLTGDILWNCPQLPTIPEKELTTKVEITNKPRHYKRPLMLSERLALAGIHNLRNYHTRRI